MKLPGRTPSLYWTFALAFLMVLALAAALQALVVFTVVRPFARQFLRAEAETLTRTAALRIETLAVGDTTLVLSPPVVFPNRPRESPILLVYVNAAGRAVADRPFPRERLRELLQRIGVSTVIDTTRFERSMPPGFSALPDSARRRDLAFGSGRWRRGGRARGWSRGVDLLARAEVEAIGPARGSVLAITPVRPLVEWPAGAPRPFLLFLPVAGLVSVGAGVLLFRGLARRLRQLELHTGRVADGDLSARIPDPGGDEIGRLGQSLNEMTARLALAREKLDSADLERRRFLADVTHELSTPLTSLRGYAETLLDPRVPVDEGEHREYLRHILASAERMDLLVRDLLDLARLEGPAPALERERLDWSSLCQEAVKRFQPRFRDAGVQLHWNGDGAAIVFADGRRLEQVIDNLLGNALRYVPRGGQVWVTSPRADRIELIVEDDGPGFEPADLPFLFNRFYRGDSARSEGGTGLGLAIVSEIVRRHEGEIRAENRTGGGASISVRLPAAR